MKTKLTNSNKWLKVSINDYFLYILGEIDGVLKGVEMEKAKIKDPFLLNLIEKQEQEWKEVREEVLLKIKEPLKID